MGVWMLIARIGAKLGALPIEHVIEIMRPLAIEPLPRAPDYVRGLAIVRGAPLPVVDTARLLGGAGAAPGRFVVLRTGTERAVLLVDDVVGVRPVARDELAALPALSGEAQRAIVESIGRLDAGLLVVLDAARILDEARVIA